MNHNNEFNKLLVKDEIVGQTFHLKKLPNYLKAIITYTFILTLTIVLNLYTMYLLDAPSGMSVLETFKSYWFVYIPNLFVLDIAQSIYNKWKIT